MGTRHLLALVLLAGCQRAPAATSVSGAAPSPDMTPGVVALPPSTGSVTAGSVSPLANAVFLADGTLVALERARPDAVPLAFRRVGTGVEVYDGHGALLRTIDVAPAPGDPAPLFGGFDLDADGLVDFGIVYTETLTTPCGAQPMHKTHLALFSSASGRRLQETDPTLDLCWTFPSTSYPTQQWTRLSVLFGPTAGRAAMFPYYAMTGQVLGGAAPRSLYYPSVPQFDTYAAARPNAHNGSTDYEPNAHVANGLFVQVGEQQRLIFFTTARLVQYAADGSNVLFDHPFLSGGRTDILGRNYGVVAVDPAAPGHIALVSGTAAWTLFEDDLTGKMATDPWGGIERHVTRYDAALPLLQDRFYSYAHDDGDGQLYQHRISYLPQPFLPTGRGPSRLAYGEYTGGHWYTHISDADGPGDTVVQRGIVPWDIADLDGDGQVELVTSPTEAASDPDVPGYYFSKWQTQRWHWNETTHALDLVGTDDGLPELVNAFPTTTITTSAGFRRPAAVVESAGRLRRVQHLQDGTLHLAP